MRRYQPALLGGLFIGVFSSLPIVGAANLCCCLWVVAGGLLTTYLLQQNQPAPLETGDAALGGLIAGLVGALIAGAVGAVFLSSRTAMMQEQLRLAFEQNTQMPSEYRDMAMRFATGRNLALVAFVVNLPIFPVMGMLGALLGVAIFRKKAPPAPPAVPGPG